MMDWLSPKRVTVMIIFRKPPHWGGFLIYNIKFSLSNQPFVIPTHILLFHISQFPG